MDGGHPSAFARVSVRTVSVGQWVLALWLMAGYALPHTIWQKVSFNALVWRLLPDSEPLRALMVAGSLFTVAWLSFARPALHDRWAQLLWLLLGALASSYLFDPLGRGYNRVEYLRCAFVLVMLAVGMVCARMLSARELMVCVVLLASVQAAYTGWYFVSGRGLFYTHSVARAGGTFGTPVHVYALMLIALPMSLSLVRDARDAIWRILLWACVMLMMGALWLTYSRSAWLAMSIVLPLTVWALWQNQRLAVVVAVCMCLAFAGMYILRVTGNPDLKDTTAQARVDVWRMGWQVFRRNWLWGVGADNVRLYYTSTWRGYAVSTWYGAPENQLLLWLCERGIWGGVLAGMLVVAVWQRLLRLSLALRWGLGGALLAIGILGMFQSVFGRVEEGMETVLVCAVWSTTLREGAKGNAEMEQGVFTA